MPTLVRAESLSETVDALNEAHFNATPLKARERTLVAKWIAARQGLPGAYGDTFAGFEHERADGIHLFTGERITSASARHVLGEETCRVLRQLDVDVAPVKAALGRADLGLLRCISGSAQNRPGTTPGTFCCGTCSVGMWRNLLSGGLDRQDERLIAGMAFLKSRRVGDGKWRAMPFWYTILALTEIDQPAARAEIRYAAGLLKRATRTRAPSTRYGSRRRELAERALARL